MNFQSTWRALGAMAIGAGLLVSSACSDTDLVGQADDSELQDPQTLPFAALGMSREINDLIYANYDLYLSGGFHDEVTYAGVSGFEQRVAIGDARPREQNGEFEQIHEAIWTGYKIVDLALAVLPEEQVEREPMVARAWLNAGFMERIMADSFCEGIFQYGAFGGFNLPNLQRYQRENGNVQSFSGADILGKDSMFTRAVYAFEQAIDVADAAIAAGTPIAEEDPAYFDPVQVREAAYAGLAQSRAALAQLGVNSTANWAAAVAAAGEVSTDFEEFWDTDDDLRENQNWQLMWDNDDLTMWSDTLLGTVWGSAYTQHQDSADDRGYAYRCQFHGVRGPTEAAIFTRSNVLNTPGNSQCASNGRSANADLETTEIPRWLLSRMDGGEASFTGDLTLIAAARGTEMRLIEAEAALVAGDFPTFNAKIAEVRAFHGAPPAPVAVTAGALEYPNAVNDGWSILDREYLLDGWGENRRLFFMHRTNHPFIQNNVGTTPRWRDRIAEQGAGYQRFSCFPIPRNECNLNFEITCDDLSAG